MNIFKESILYANPKGYFVDKLKGKPKDCEEIRSVSFTFCDHMELYRHFNRRDSEYGICFFHDFLQDRGLRPVAYLNDKDKVAMNRLIFNSPHLIEVHSPKYDMRWENEWRLKNDLHFTENDIAFVIVPPKRVNYYIEWFHEQEDFQTVEVISSNAFHLHIDHLINYPQQDNNSWGQVEVFGDRNSKGLKLSPEDFNKLDKEKKYAFAKTVEEELRLFSKNLILSSYEHAYTRRFRNFQDQVADLNTLDNLFAGRQAVLENTKEPHDAERDLVKALFENLYETFPIYSENF